MNNSQVAHTWAQQRKDSGSGSNFYFKGKTIYSYGPHFPIATFADASTVLFTTDSYSNSTCKHINYTRRALHGLPIRVFNVPHLSGCESDNVQSYQERFEKALLDASRARSYAQMHIETAQALQAEAADYCRAFNLELPRIMADTVSPALIASAKNRANEAKKRDTQAREERLRARATIEAGERDEWRRGIGSRYFDNPTMLRLSFDKQSIETSRGAFVPVFDAKALWAIVARCKRERRSLDAGGSRIGEFTLRSIRANGDCVVGCHELPFNESARLANSLGWNV